MGKNKLSKFADMEKYPHVFQYPYSTVQQENFSMKGRWCELFFHNNNPIVIELGCGRGEYTVALAKMFPDKNFIGVDIKGARMWTGATEALSSDLKNVAFLRTNIEIIDSFFGINEVDEIWLTFPDPQMKSFTKRLTSTAFLERYRHFLKKEGSIHLKTDSNFLYTYTQKLIEVNSLPVLCSTVDLYHGNFVDHILDIKTYYEKQWLERGIAIKYIHFKLFPVQNYVEPDIEIPLDDYRSYNRSKRSELLSSK